MLDSLITLEQTGADWGRLGGAVAQGPMTGMLRGTGVRFMEAH